MFGKSFRSLLTIAALALSFSASAQLSGGTSGGSATFDKARIYRTAAFTSGAAALVKVPNETVSYDPSTLADTTNNRLTPKKSGYYLVNGSACISTNASPGTARLFVSVEKNGTEVFRGTDTVNSQTAQFLCSSGSDFVFFNGTTDYVELWMYTGVATSVVVGSPGYNTFLSIAGPFTP